MKKVTSTVLCVTLTVILALLMSPLSSSISGNPCSPCHSSHYQFLDAVEVDERNQVPTTLNLTETKFVTVVIQNIVNTDIYATLTGVSVTLSSRYGHFSVNNPTYNLGDLPPGQIPVTWQITGISEGFDYLLIEATGRNPHRNLFFADSYLPYPFITVGQPTGTPPPPPTPTPPPASTPTSSAPPPTPSQTPTSTPTPTSSPTPSNRTQLSIQLLSPSQGEKWLVGTTHSIEWKASGGTNPLNITLENAISNSTGPWATIAKGLPNNGSFTWAAPDNALTMYIRVSVNDSEIPPQTASAIVMVEVVVETDHGLPLIIIPILAVLLTVIALAGILFKRRRKSKAKESPKHKSATLRLALSNYSNHKW